MSRDCFVTDVPDRSLLQHFSQFPLKSRPEPGGLSYLVLDRLVVSQVERQRVNGSSADLHYWLTQRLRISNFVAYIRTRLRQIGDDDLGCLDHGSDLLHHVA